MSGHRSDGAARGTRAIADRGQFGKQADPDGEAAPAELALEQQPIGCRHRFEEGHQAPNEIAPAFLRQGWELQDARQILHQPHQSVLGEDFPAREVSGQGVQDLLNGFAALAGGQQRCRLLRFGVRVFCGSGRGSGRLDGYQHSGLHLA
ncbi:hypothetical protein D9M72_411480 [compost metagenome]